MNFVLVSTPKKKAALAGNARNNVGPSPRKNPLIPVSSRMSRTTARNVLLSPVDFPDWKRDFTVSIGIAIVLCEAHG